MAVRLPLEYGRDGQDQETILPRSARHRSTLRPADLRICNPSVKPDWSRPARWRVTTETKATLTATSGR